MKTTQTIAAVILMSGLMLTTGCQKKNPVSGDVSNTNSAEGFSKVTVNSTTLSGVSLIAGQSINAGTVSFDDIDTNNDNIDDAMVVTYATTDGWELTGFHFAIGSGISAIPVNKSGNPVPGQFPTQATFTAGVTSHSFLVSFATLSITCPSTLSSLYYVAAHANVRKLVNGAYQTETGWGAGNRIATKGNWGMYFTINISCDEEEVEYGTCAETAFAKAASNSTCLSEYNEELGISANRWGWTNGIAPGNYTMTLWAGAGQCNTSNGTNVGSLFVNYSNGTAVITYSTTGGYSLNACHLYAGSTPLYYKEGNGNNDGYTVAPGSQPYKQDGLAEGTHTWTRTINNLSGNIYVLAHADVKGFVCE